MVPFADNINHENVDSDFDCVDRGDNNKSLGLTAEQKEDEERAEVCEKHEFYENMKSDLLKMEETIRNKLAENGGEVQSEETKNKATVDLKL